MLPSMRGVRIVIWHAMYTASTWLTSPLLWRYHLSILNSASYIGVKRVAPYLLIASCDLDMLLEIVYNPTAEEYIIRIIAQSKNFLSMGQEVFIWVYRTTLSIKLR